MYTVRQITEWFRAYRCVNDTDIFGYTCVVEETTIFANHKTDFASNIFVGGLLGCKGDAYRSEGSLDEVGAYRFHKIQVEEFRKGRVDLLFAGIMPVLSETLGLAQAMAESGIPYMIKIAHFNKSHVPLVKDFRQRLCQE